jgi:chromosome segregation ATPase
MSFPTAEELLTLADARTAYSSLRTAHDTVLADLYTKEGERQNALAESEALRADIAAASEILEEAAKEKQAHNAKLADAEAVTAQKAGELARALEKVSKLQTCIGQLEAEAKSAEAKAAQICASVGVEPAQVSPGGEPMQQSLLEQMRSIQNPAEQMAFFRKHREAIIRGS